MKSYDHCNFDSLQIGDMHLKLQQRAKVSEEQYRKFLQMNSCQAEQQILIGMRRKLQLHQFQNFNLKQQISRLKHNIVELQKENVYLKGQIDQNVKELAFADQALQKYQNELDESKEYVYFLEQKVKTLQKEGDENKLLIQNQKNYQINLNQQNQVLIEIKRILKKQNHDLRVSYEQIHHKYLQNQSQLDKLKAQSEYLMKSLLDFQNILHDRNSEILNHEVFLNKKNHQLRKDRHFFAWKYSSDVQLQNKLQKYKRKAFKYKQERDQLLQQIEEAKDQIGSITLSKYLEQKAIHEIKLD